MKALLMHADRDLELGRELPADTTTLTQDLELEVMWRAMADGDEFLFDVARRVILCSLDDPDAIAYRQRVLADCLENPAIVRDLYAIAIAAIQAEHGEYFGLLFGHSPDSTLYRSVRVLEAFVTLLQRLKRVADEHGARFRSPGLHRFFAMIRQELSDEYFAEVQTHLRQLQFPNGCLISARLGPGNKGRDHALRLPLADKRTWVQRLFDHGEPSYSFEIADRDEAGMRALAELRGRGINPVAAALAQSVDHILAFFEQLRTELGFYIGCLNLREKLLGKGEPACIPRAQPAGGTELSASGLYDVCLALTVGDTRVVGNDLEADGRDLVIITGANGGGNYAELQLM